jgi:hypothetical protein
MFVIVSLDFLEQIAHNHVIVQLMENVMDKEIVFVMKGML